MDAYLDHNHCKVYKNNLKSILIKKGFGEKKEDYLILDFFESFYLFENKKINIIYNNEILKKEDILKKIKIKNFQDKFLVYKDFREKGYILKDGSSFGFDFRVYENKSKKHEHTKYVLDVKKTHKDEMSKIIKSERLANTINAKYILAIIDLDKKITKLKIERI
jgi:tRNA-intron endonuclease, archaea type